MNLRVSTMDDINGTLAFDESIKDGAYLSPEVKARFKKEGIFGLGQAYMDGLWDVPKLDEFMFSLFTVEEDKRRLPWPEVLRQVWRQLVGNPNAGLAAYNIAKEHYDLGNELFETMLDDTMTYTCGYWKDAQTLTQAQEAKLELICKKLHLESGQHILDIGCGWGNFAEFAAKNYGVQVTGVTVSKEQANFAKQRCNGLPVKILLQDYRDIQGSFDHLVSIEMIEAVGKRNLPTFYSVAERLLKPGGLFLVQVISTETLSSASNKRVDQFLFWILKNIFPDGYLPKHEELLRPCKGNFVLEDWHNFGPDYDKTLLAWADNFNDGWDSLKYSYDERFKRRWNFYLYSCAALFRARLVQLYQIVYSKGGLKESYERSK